MKKLLLASSLLLFLLASCKTKKTKATDDKVQIDTVVVLPLPASDNPTKYDSLKNELNKRRQKKKKN